MWIWISRARQCALEKSKSFLVVKCTRSTEPSASWLFIEFMASRFQSLQLSDLWRFHSVLISPLIYDLDYCVIVREPRASSLKLFPELFAFCTFAFRKENFKLLSWRWIFPQGKFSKNTFRLLMKFNSINHPAFWQSPFKTESDAQRCDESDLFRCEISRKVEKKFRRLLISALGSSRISKKPQ